MHVINGLNLRDRNQRPVAERIDTASLRQGCIIIIDGVSWTISDR